MALQVLYDVLGITCSQNSIKPLQTHGVLDPWCPFDFRPSCSLPCTQILDPEDDPEEEEEDGGAQDIDATRSAKSAVMKTSTRQVRMSMQRSLVQVLPLLSTCLVIR